MTGKEEGNESIECCMCGDSGLSHELLLCSNCRLRSQHRYCSNIYPNSDSYDICNWCLSQTADAQDKSQSSSNMPSFCRTDGAMARKRKTEPKKADVKRPKRVSSAGDDQVKPVNGGERNKSSSAGKKNVGRRRIITKGKLEEMVKRRRTKSEEISNKSNGRVIIKNGFRNRVRRYKLLDEVSN